MDTTILDSIRGGLQGPLLTGLVYLLAALVVVFVCAIVLHVVLRQLRRRRLRAAGWRALAAHAADLGLGMDGKQPRTLRRLAELETPDEPMAVTQQIAVFEKAVQRYLDALRAGRGERTHLQQAATIVRFIRVKLGFDLPPPVVYYSTRELAAGQEVYLCPKAGESAGSALARVGAKREDFLHLVELERAPAWMGGQPVEVLFYSGTHAFSFNADVVEVNEEAASCLLTHTLDVKLAGRRRRHRVKVDQPVTFGEENVPAEARRQGLLWDLSDGGACILGPRRYEKGDEFLVSIRLAHCLGEAEQHASADLDVVGTIVEVRQSDDERCFYHIAFRRIRDDDRRDLFRLVNRLDRPSRPENSRGSAFRAGGKKSPSAGGAEAALQGDASA